MQIPNPTSALIAQGIARIPKATEILNSLATETGLGIAIFGGTLRDLIAFGEPGHDLDVLVFGEKNEGFNAAVQRVASQFNAQVIDYPGSHIVLAPKNSTITIDIHYPKKTFLEGLVRSDFTVNGMGFLWKEQQFEDPFGGAKHIQEKKLVMHSPQYVVTNPPNFPRMFRTAAKLGFTIEGETEQILRRCAVMITLHEGKTNVRTLFELMKFISLPAIAPYLKQMHQFRLIEAIFPELVILATVAVAPNQSLLDRNVAFAASFDGSEYEGNLKEFMLADLGLGITNRGVLRLMAFFLDLGAGYGAFRKDAPYIKAVSHGDLDQFARRIDKSLLSHIGARYGEAKKISEIFIELPMVLQYLRDRLASGEETPPDDSLSPIMKLRAQILLAAIRELRKKQ